MSERHCKFERAKRYVCPYEPEERKVELCLICRMTKLIHQQDLIIKQNRAIVTVLNQARDLLIEIRDFFSSD